MAIIPNKDTFYLKQKWQGNRLDRIPILIWNAPLMIIYKKLRFMFACGSLMGQSVLQRQCGETTVLLT